MYKKVIDERNKKFDSARELAASAKGKRATDPIQKLITEIQDEERISLTEGLNNRLWKITLYKSYW